MAENIYLTGFMGVGKSTAGRRLAAILNRRFVDMDETLEKEEGRTIREIFAGNGEPFFRSREKALLKRLARRRNLVVATGGGLPADQENRRVMRDSGLIVHLEASLEACLGRLNSQDTAARPMLGDMAGVAALYESRKAFYADNDYALSVEGVEPDALPVRIAERLFPREVFTVKTPEKECPVITAWDAPGKLAGLVDGRRVLMLTDTHVARLHGERFSRALDNPLILALPAGERTKSLKSLEKIYSVLLEQHFDRGDLLVAVGGGMITDLGAMAAATFKRGLHCLLVSTTLLGAVDAAVGGKAAVNFRNAKNAVGVFTIPDAVILDTASLGTLAASHLRDGLVEAYKTGLVADAALAGLIEEEAGLMLAKDLPLLSRVVQASARAKAGVVEIDFRESGWRAVLNLGHTYGHAVESWSGFRISHGRAVGLGLRVAAAVSRNRGLIDNDFYEVIDRTIKAIMPQETPRPPLDEAWEMMKHDKKIRRGRMVFVLLKGRGEPLLVDDVAKAELETALKALKD